MSAREALALGATLFVGAVLGAIGASTFAPRDTREAPLVAPLAQREQGAAERATLELAQAVRELRAHLAARDVAPPASPAAGAPALDARQPMLEPSSERSADPDALAGALLELARAIRSMPRTEPEPFELPPFPLPDRRIALLGALRLPAAAYRDEEVEAQAERAMLDKHMLWTGRDLVEAYGRPDNIWPSGNGGEQWHYEIRYPDGWREEYDFFLHGEKVTTTDVSYAGPVALGGEDG